MQARHSRRQGGFTLVEMAVVLVILGVIGVILARWMGTTTLEHTHALQRTLLQRADDAVLGFATIQHRLPCPDTDGDGLENCDGSAVAMLPYRTIGLPDARAARVRYGVLRRAGDSAVLADWDTSANRAADREVVLDADLAATRDRTRVLQVFLNDPDLAPAHTVEPWDNCGHLPAGASGCDEAPQLHLNGLDFCAAIRNAAMLPPSPQHVHTRHEDALDQIAGNVAYAMGWWTRRSRRTAPRRSPSSRRGGLPAVATPLTGTRSWPWASTSCGPACGAANTTRPPRTRIRTSPPRRAWSRRPCTTTPSSWTSWCPWAGPRWTSPTRRSWTPAGSWS